MIGRPRSLRARLTLWYTAALAGLLAVLGVTAAVLLERGLQSTVDASLMSVANVIDESSRQSQPFGPDFADTLESLFGPGVADRFYQLLDPRGRPDPRLAPHGRERLPLSPEALRNAEAGRETFETVPLPASAGGRVRLLTRPVVERGRLAHLVQVAMPLAFVDAARGRFLLVLVGLVPFALAGAATGGWFLAGRALAPVDAMVEAARRIEAEDLSRRLAGAGSGDELGRLAAVLNDMLARLERSFATVRQFSADAAHELRTPLTILKGEIEVALRAAPDTDEYRRVLASCLEEVDRLGALVEDLLFLARADAAPPPEEPVDLAAVIDDVTPALEALAERGGVALAVEMPGPLPLRGSASMLFRMVLNLGDNAIKYAGAGGQVSVTVRQDDGRAVLEVRDTGPGIAPHDQPHVFDRFYRGDPARERGGTGLGLALTRSIVVVHGGRIDVESTQGAGTCFRVVLPLPPT